MLKQIYILWAKYRAFNFKNRCCVYKSLSLFIRTAMPMRCAYEVIVNSTGSLRLTIFSACLPYVNYKSLLHMRVLSQTYTKFNLN